MEKTLKQGKEGLPSCYKPPRQHLRRAVAILIQTDSLSQVQTNLKGLKYQRAIRVTALDCVS